ncbi:hypothetical protein ASPACDRAFT_45101 [Aspergillus aculeatus ATCC 16872]|uniref:Alpha/beta hydrolase fold-3 domain-containing protein n=1 Tax=Aspergillus aculeatus (strain ATCC 16872 / CBS 172.66 / WB 5094) TaxID=690307 RepID=A0A1L9WNS1_ASPA1|nr:uncharacterized protein ASPACDRAFT_45101 [Aspergillus aculeatus ATCC 16872]OJJ97803.1 hypothetical protein ASPACDRAFT_45101 [Aspergillus aculeatus ATCC 16872]
MVNLTDPKLQGFDLISAVYKTVGDHGIRTDILVPQAPHTGRRPTIIRFHGGGLMIADSLFMAFWSPWLSDLALKHGAVIISPNYRLMPQANGLDILEDIEDLWKWVNSSAARDLLAAHSIPTELDLTRVLAVGDSAGGLLSLNFALSHANEIRAAMACYPMADMSIFNSPAAAPPFGHHTPESIVNEALASERGKKIISSWSEPESLPFMLSAIEHGRLGEWYKRGTEGDPRAALLSPMQRLQPGVGFPRGGIVCIHGKQDSVVPVSQSENFIARARKITQGQAVNERLVLTVQDGEHGFDDIHYETKWLKDTLKTAVETWLE